MTSQSTILKFMTDGMLLREAMHDPILQRLQIFWWLSVNPLFNDSTNYLPKLSHLNFIFLNAGTAVLFWMRRTRELCPQMCWWVFWKRWDSTPLSTNSDCEETLLINIAHLKRSKSQVILPLQVMLKRPDLKIVVMSATLDALKFQEYFDNAPLMKVTSSTLLHWLRVISSLSICAWHIKTWNCTFILRDILNSNHLSYLWP